MISEILSWIAAPYNEGRAKQLQLLLCQYFRDLLKPIVALPGAQRLKTLPVLASGVLSRDIFTGTTSASAALISVPPQNQLDLDEWITNIQRLLPQHAAPDDGRLEHAVSD